MNLIHLSGDEYIGGFHFLAIVSKVPVNTDVQIFLHYPIFILLDVYIEVGLLHYITALVLVLMNLHTAFHSDHTILHSSESAQS